ncbi:NAD(P)H-dependent oxidoreductase [Spirosoma sp. BT702]|uniref:NAD(P)H-dependent oxidoreductase n=1 Tax=Spirosoma profusum TaxID=2771354 RepID=A0A926XXA9_9BACT|nr:NAD(P)H-dependent oxidoreductase [Spirosoma profusum]MBD2701746.1 NAD(P)H-dependent oxidoreductase [Spirosoma profusum]
MPSRKTIFAIIGSASKNSSNLKLVNRIADVAKHDLDIIIFDRLSELPPFNPEQSVSNVPESITQFRAAIQDADGLLICTPEYIFSMPSGLKNAIEWCVASTVFSGKPIGLITASASGQMGHEELKIIIKTVETVFTEDTTLLIQGIKGKIDVAGAITDADTQNKLIHFIDAFVNLVQTHSSAT